MADFAARREASSAAGPSIHEAFDEGVPDRLARRSGLGDRHHPTAKDGWLKSLTLDQPRGWAAKR